MTNPSDTAVDIAVDNDVLLKASCYGIADVLWPAESRGAMGALGAARFVLRRAIERKQLTRDKEAAKADLEALIASVSVLEPTSAEEALAAEMEAAAQRRAVELDVGESLLAAMLILRSMSLLETGDKRAIAALEAILDDIDGGDNVAGRVRCLEQMVAAALTNGADVSNISNAVCGEPKVDKALNICFGCHSGGCTEAEPVLEALGSYVRDLRSTAPRVIGPDQA